MDFKKITLSIAKKIGFLIPCAVILSGLCLYYIKSEGDGSAPFDFSRFLPFLYVASYVLLGLFLLFLPSFVYYLVQIAIIVGIWYNLHKDYVKKHMTKEEKDLEMIKDLPRQKKIFLKKFNEGEIFTPNEFVYNNIKLRTKEGILDIINSPCTKTENDSIEYNKTLFYHLFCFNDSKQTMTNKGFITESFRIDTMLFSPKFDKIIAFITYGETYIDDSSKTKKYYVCNTFAGKIVGDTIFFGNLSDLDSPYEYPAQDCAFYIEFNRMDDELRILNEQFSFVNKDFWEKAHYFKKVMVGNKEYFDFQYNSYKKWPNPTLKVPI